ncbi:hypothetical protein L3049_13295 [Labilibaculum sp. DW002]|uniref:Uncharacterized protein n=1 Tax=Paralabilibaculum antarcticum TaxID=2912572 RepID=A0ABT5VU85_9BACT|nr:MULTISPECIES: hypothetical protein [unclassified Labilibaculum]MBI9058025.1 hypothetical protein [Labilibaculum sp.]MDE5418975.1 hypothetical protein [Labilibaculum sp. DW002]
MTTIDLKLTLQLKENEYFKVGDHIFTKNENLEHLEGKLHFCGSNAIEIFKEYESLLSMEIMEKWSKLIKALNQTTSCCAVWDNKKIIQELVEKQEHSVSWYVENCRIC